MKKIFNNPYRIIGIIANASSKEIQSRKGKIQAFARVGKAVTSEYDFPFLSSCQRNNEDIDKAFSDIEQNQNKVTHALFWFINLNAIDNAAIQHLISGNSEKAIEIWEKLTAGKEVSDKNFSAFNNIGTLYLLENSIEKIKQGITTKIKLITSEYFKDFAHTVADETFTIDTHKQTELFIDELLSQFKQSYSVKETMGLFSDCDEIVQTYLSKKFTEEPVHIIEIQIERTKNKRIEDKISAYQYGSSLFSNTKNELALLKSILGTENLQYQMLADNVAKELLQCAIDYFNESQEQGNSNDYIADSLKISQWAESVAASEITKSKAREDIKTLEGMKDRELLEAIAVLKSVKDAYEANKADITSKVMSIHAFRLHSVNWTKVDEVIKKSIDWNKVVELVKETIPQKNVEKIKTINNPSALNEFKSLVDFLLENLNFSQTNQIKYICYWKTENVASSVEFTVKTLPEWACLGIAGLLLLLIVGLIWGEDGLAFVFGVSLFLGALFFAAWLRTK